MVIDIQGLYVVCMCAVACAHEHERAHLSVLASAHMCLVCVPFSIKAEIAQQA